MSPIEEVIINKKSDINPIWIMRQAGRYLPEFREIRKQNPDFIKLCLNEKLSSEITLQPLKRFDLDAAIIFSDILMLPYGLNQTVEFKKNVGPLLGNFDLIGIPPAPRGVPQIEVTFDIDANGIVNVSAKDKGTGKEQQIKIQASGGLSEEEIDKMVKEAEANAEADKKKREGVDVKNQADTMIHSAEKNLKEFGDKVSEQEKNTIENDIKTLKESVASDDTDKIKSGLEALTQSSMKLGEAMYKAQQQDAPNPNEPSDNTAAGSDQNNEKVVDAEFEEVKEDNKQS